MTTEYCNEYINKLTENKWVCYEHTSEYMIFFYLSFQKDIIGYSKTIKILNDNSVNYSEKSEHELKQIFLFKEDLVCSIRISIRDNKINEILNIE